MLFCFKVVRIILECMLFIFGMCISLCMMNFDNVGRFGIIMCSM